MDVNSERNLHSHHNNRPFMIIIFVVNVHFTKYYFRYNYVNVCTCNRIRSWWLLVGYTYRVFFLLFMAISCPIVAAHGVIQSS